MWHEKQFLRRHAVVGQIFSVSLPDHEKAVEPPQQGMIQNLLGPTFEQRAGSQELGVAPHEHWHTRPTARPHRLPIRLQMPAGDDESVETRRRWAMGDGRWGVVASFNLRSSICYLLADDLGDFRRVAAEKMVHTGLAGNISQKTVAVAGEQIHVPLEGHAEPGLPLLCRRLPVGKKN